MSRETRALLLTDLADSTRLVGTLGDARAAEVFAAHDRLARALLPPHHGREIDRTEGFLLLFDTVADAAGYALAYHRALATLSKELGLALTARAGIHEGMVILRENLPADIALGAKPLEVEGLAKPTAARIMALALGSQTLLSEPARTALEDLPQGCEIQSHGHYRLKGVAEPMELFEIGARGESPFMPPADAAKAYRVVRRDATWQPAREIPHSLPAERDAFIGRSEELHDLALRLDAGARLVTVLGMGGTGKTRFVRRYGWNWLGDWPGGVFFCDLSEARSLDGIVSVVAAALDIPLGKDDPIVQIGHAIAGRPKCLIILDNFEQVMAHAGATVGRWLDCTASASFIVTSRERLAIAGEQLMPLAPLSPEGAGVELFVVRAHARKADFVLTPDNEGTVRDIVTLLDGLPLAIELAAARSTVLSPEQLLARLKDRFQILVGARGGQARQATLRAAIDWSWMLLAPWEQAALAQASVFVGGFTLEAAESVLDLSTWPEAPMAMDVVQSLVDKSLLRTWTPGASRRIAIDEPYFGMYVSIHEYAGEKLRTAGALPGDASGAAAETAAFQRHGGYFARFGTEEAISALTLHGGVTLRQALTLELENLVAGCRRAASRADGPTAVATFIAAVAVIDQRGPHLLAAELGRQVLAVGTLLPVERGRASRILADSMRIVGRMDEALRYCQDALAIARETCDRASEAAALGSLGVTVMNLGRRDEALQVIQDALALVREVGNRAAEGLYLSTLGTWHWYQGRKDEALRHYQEALAIHREVGNRQGEGSALTNSGIVHLHQGRVAEALRCYEEALAINREAGGTRVECNILLNMGVLYREQGMLEEALRHYEASLAIHRREGLRAGQAILLSNMSMVYEQQGRLDEALGYCDDAFAIATELGDRVSEGVILGNRALLLEQQGRMDDSLRAFIDALAIHREVGNRSIEAKVLTNLGLLHAVQGQLDEAREAMVGAETILRDLNERALLGELLGNRGQTERLAGDLPAARRYLAEAEAIARELEAGPETDLAKVIAVLREELEKASEPEGI